MNDFATQQNVIMELLSEEVKKVFFGENNTVATTDIAEARLLSFSLLGGRILDAENKLLFFILPKTYKEVKSSIGTLVLDIDGNLYEIPNLNSESYTRRCTLWDSGMKARDQTEMST